MRMYRVRVDIREAATRYRILVVRHEFFGRTPDEAWGYHDSHRKSDAFLRACEDGRKCRPRALHYGGVTCLAEITEGWTRR